jgi:uncharacterized protein (TIGR03083 family)
MNATEMYRAVQDSMIELYSSLSAEETMRLVPTCPEWTVKDVLAHVVGIGSDFRADRREGSGGEAWTTAQVKVRAESDVDEILAEWADLGGFMDEFFEANEDMAWALVADLVTHEHDVRLALDRPGDRTGAAVSASAQRYADRFLERVADSDLESVAVVIDGSRRGDPDVNVVLQGSAFELLRAFTGRRSLDQIETMDWGEDSGRYLELISAYGPASATAIDE